MTGRNTIESATAALYSFRAMLIKNEVDETLNRDWYYELADLIDRLNMKNEHIKIEMLNLLVDQMLRRDQLDHDKGLVSVAAIAMTTYLLFFLGSCSPVHCRITLVFTGLFCIAISIYAGYAVA